MRVKDLKEMIADMPDDCVVLVPGSDHSYYEAQAFDSTVAFNDAGGIYTEWAGEQHADPDETPRRALVME